MIADSYINHLIQFSKNDVPFLILFAILLLLFTRTLFSTRKNLAPGPYGLPIVGYLPFLGKNPHFTVDKLSKIYGGIFGLHLGPRYVVILSSYEALKEGLAKSELLGRPNNAIFKCLKAERAIVSIEGKEWEEQRRFMLHLLRDLGFGKSKMEEYVKEEIDYFLECIGKKEGKPFVLKNFLVPSVSNNISSFVFGKRMEYDDPHKIALDNNFSQLVMLIGQVSAPVFFPWLLPILRKLNITSYVKFMDSVENFHSSIRDEIMQHKATINYENITDFTDGYILKMREKNKNESTSFDDKMLFGNVRTLFAAGSDTVKTVLDWSFLILGSFDECQKRIRDEIEKATRNERAVCWADRLQMPYTQAFISEVLRWRTITPLSIMRRCMADTTIQGFHVPKDTFILTNLWSVHKNPEYWNEPEVFHPERFLNEDQTQLDCNEAFMPFSLGKRACPGKIFALLQLFLYVTSVLQRYTICLPEGEKHDFLGEFGQSYQPKPWKVYLIERT